MAKEEFMEELKMPEAEAPEQSVDTESDDDFQFEVVDDTPEEDRNKEPLAEKPEPDEEELASYSDRVKKRISTLQRAYHDERRAKEQALREQQEAIKYAQSVLEKNKTLIKKTNTDATLLHETWKSKVETDLERAKQMYKAAYESGDAESILEAQDALSRATVRHEAALSQQPTLQPENDAVEPNRSVYTEPAPDPQAEAWVKKNPWFGPDRIMTALAYGIHEDLTSRGVHPIRDANKYYGELDRVMRERFPDYSWGDSGEKVPRQQKQPAATVVAPVTRSATGKKVALTQTQIAIAKRLNIPLKEYAKQVAALNGGNNG
jgi:hypothetical protein